jgi:putative ABC transport system permease protein
LVGGSADAVHLDLTAFTFTLALSVITAMAFGVLPARLAARVDPQDALRERTRGTTTDRRHQRLTGGLVVSQIALAVALLVGAGLLLRTLSSLVRVPLGFEPSGTVTMGLFLGVRPPSTRAQVVDRIIDRVQQVPGVKAAGTIQFLPLSGATCGTAFWLEADAGIRDPARSLPIECALVSRGYVAAMGIRVVDGRAFDRQDTMTSPRVLMVNEAFARRYVPGGHAPGRRILVQGSNQALAEIVGVVGDVRHDGLTSDVAPTVYLLHAQTPGYITNLVVRTAGEPMAQALAVRHAIHDVDPTEAASNARTIQTDVAKVLAKPRLYALLVTLFAAIAVLLATVGLYGLLSYVVTQHAREIGIRLALGATRQQVFVEQLRGGARLMAAGLVIGTAAALGARQLLASHLFGVTTADPATYLLAILTLSAAAVIAIVVPAARASAIEPLRALRNE